MIAREAVLNDPGIVALLRERFVCLAVDNADGLNLTTADREWLRDRGGRACTQGMTVFTAGGALLGTGGGYRPEPVKRMLDGALAKFRPEESVVVEDTGRDAIRRPPEGGLVLTVTWRVLLDAEHGPAPTSRSRRNDLALLRALGVDRIWVRKDEVASLVEGDLPESLRRRMAPQLKRVLPGGLKIDRLTLGDGRLQGTYTSNENDTAHALGFVESRDGKITRFDLIVKGLGLRATDHGFSAGLNGVPEGTKAPIALAFMLADPAEDMSRMPPYRSRAADYLK